MRIAQRNAGGWYAIEGAVTDAAIGALVQVGSVDRLAVTNCPLLTVKSAKLLCSLPRVEWLWLWCDVTRAAASHLIGLPGLTSLDILAVRQPGILSGFERASTLQVLRANHYLTDSDLVAIARAPQLRELGAQGAKLTLPALEALLANATLQSLDFEGTAFNDEMAKATAQSTVIRHLDLGATELTQQGLEFLTSMKQLQSLDLWATGICEKDLELLLLLPHLEYVSVGGYSGKESLNAEFLVSIFCSMPSLKRVWLDGVWLNPAQIATLEESLDSVRVTS